MKTKHDRPRTLPGLLAELRDFALARARAHPQGHLLDQQAEALELSLDLPLIGDLGPAERTLGEGIDAAIETTLARLAVGRPGRVPCQACASSECEHALTPDPRFVFVGYRVNGTPRFQDLGQWLLDRGDPRVGILYEEPPGFVALPFSEEELHRQLESGPRRSRGAVRLRGQVGAGWFQLPGPSGISEKFAVGFQLLTLGRQTQLHTVGLGPGGESLDALQSRLGGAPWDEPARWAAAAARTFSAPAKGGARAAAQQRRIDGLLAALARRLEKAHRGRRRRTHHAEDRHTGGRRPTRMAMTDLGRAGEEALLFDERHGTIVVLGDRGRTHFFTPQGRLVSSVRYSPEAIERRRKRGLWQAASEELVEQLRAAQSSD